MTYDQNTQSHENSPETSDTIDTRLTQGRSPTVHGANMNFDIENTRRELIAMRLKHGAETPVGHRISNLIEQCENLRTATGEQRTHLIANIEKSMADIKKLTPDHPGEQRH